MHTVLSHLLHGVLACAGMLGAVSARAADETITKLAQTGRIVLGVRDSAVPVSYLAPTGEHIGYHIDICRSIVTAIQREYALPPLKVVMVPTTLATRYALLGNESIDVECGHNPVTSSALQQALLSHATLVSDIRVMTTNAHAQLTLAQLGGRSVGLIAGSGSASSLRMLTRNSGMKPKETFTRNGPDAFELLSTGRVEAIAMSEPYMLARRALSADPARYIVLAGSLKPEPVALMFRLKDEKLHALANKVLAGMMQSGEMMRLYDKWFMQPVPGLPGPLNMPASAATRGLFAEPGSEMLKM